jgi:ADP-ribose pyrophosphatase YjhB (NUDIX family)
MKNHQFEVCIRAVIYYRNKILVCRHKERGYYFFPGGHLNFGESIKDALLREMREELNVRVKGIKFIGLVNNVYEEAGKKHHEINLVFDTKVDKITEDSKENHIDFFLFDKDKFAKEKILPEALQKAILRWLKDKKIFWASQIYDKYSLN